MAIDLRFWVEM